MSCRFTQWCGTQDCTVQPLVDFVLITRGRFDRAYLRMNQRGGGLRVFVGGNAYFARHDADAAAPDLARRDHIPTTCCAHRRRSL